MIASPFYIFFCRFIIFLARFRTSNRQSSTQDYVYPSTGHVRRNCHCPRISRLGNNRCFPFVVFSIKNVMWNLFLLEVIGNNFIFFNRSSANKHWLSFLMAFLNFGNNRSVFCPKSFIDRVLHVTTHHRLIGWDYDYIQVVNLFKFIRLGRCGSGHSRKMFIHPKVILK